jgi:hypothetical protein
LLLEINAFFEAVKVLLTPFFCLDARFSSHSQSAEALAAIGQPSSLELLRRFAVDETCPVEVRETCQLSLDMIAWREQHPERVRVLDQRYFCINQKIRKTCHS